MDSDISPSVRDFIDRHIASVEQVEILLILQEAKERDWSVAEINVRVRSQESSIRKWLMALVAMRLVSDSDDRFRFAPKSDELARDAADLAAAYHDRRIKVIELIFSKPNENLLNFVRAFDLRNQP